MTSPTTARPAHAEPANPIYPLTYGGWPPCARCFRQRDLAWNADPAGPGLIRICHGCSAATWAGRPIDLPADEELAEVWKTLARLHHNHEIDDATLDAALGTLRPGQPLPDGGYLVLRLQRALLRLQAAGPYDLARVDNRRSGVDGVLAELTGVGRE